MFKERSYQKNKYIYYNTTNKSHFFELRSRGCHILFSFIFLSMVIFFNIKFIVELLEIPTTGIKLFQLSPDEYFIETIKISLYIGLILLAPMLMVEIKLFIDPGLVRDEKKILLPLLIMAIILVGISIIFSYTVLIPAAIKFFIIYSENVIAPLWSFVDYFDFILSIFLITVIVFQIPTIQLILGIFNIISGTLMLSVGKYVVLFAFIISALLTPSTDPFTQFLLSFAILVLYFLGSSILILAKG